MIFHWQIQRMGWTIALSSPDRAFERDDSVADSSVTYNLCSVKIYLLMSLSVSTLLVFLKF